MSSPCMEEVVAAGTLAAMAMLSLSGGEGDGVQRFITMGEG